MELEPQHDTQLTAQAAIDSALTALQKLPTISDDAMNHVLHLIARMPVKTQKLALQIMAGKLAHDFAFRFLNLLAYVSEQESALLPLESESVQQLVKRWCKITEEVSIDSSEQFEKFALSSTGLQRMMEAAPAHAKINWVYDSGIFFETVIREEGYAKIPEQRIKINVLSVHVVADNNELASYYHRITPVIESLPMSSTPIPNLAFGEHKAAGRFL